MESRRCAGCGEAACQRQRRRRWQQAKRAGDADYRENQRRAQRAWAQRHGDYWRDYRRRHPDYCRRNRVAARQRQRESVARAGLVCLRLRPPIESD
jgi:hypothetical protein